MGIEGFFSGFILIVLNFCEVAEKITSAKKCQRDTLISLFTSAITSAFAECQCELERLEMQSGIRILIAKSLSRLPSLILNVSESNVFMNETLIGLLRENWGSGERQKRSSRKKLAKPGELSSEKQAVVDQQPCSSKLSGSKHSEVNNEDVCRCNYCWVKMMMATSGLSVISVVKSTIFSVLALIMQKSNITILILKMICFFVKNVNESLADRCIHVL